MTTYFAKLDWNNNVTQVIVADQEFINSGAVGDPNSWVETFEGDDYAGIGDKYDQKTKKFVHPKPCRFCMFMRGMWYRLTKKPCKDCPNKK